MVTMQIIKQTADNEQVSFDMKGAKDSKDLQEAAKVLFAIVDDRIWDHSRRVLEATEAVKKLPKEVQVEVHGIYEGLFGRKAPTRGPKHEDAK